MVHGMTDLEMVIAATRTGSLAVAVLVLTHLRAGRREMAFLALLIAPRIRVALDLFLQAQMEQVMPLLDAVDDAGSGSGKDRGTPRDT